MLAFNRKVSFDSINPNKEYSPDDPPFIPPQYLKFSDQDGSKRYMDLDFGFKPTQITDVEKVFQSFSQIGTPASSKFYYPQSTPHKPKKKAPKLPPPPSKTILKNCSKSSTGALVHLTNNRKKSIVDMTTEELLALDQQYRQKGVDLNDLKFEGNDYLPFYNELNAIDTKRTKQIKKIDKAMTSVVKNCKNQANVFNFHSFSTHYAHEDYKDYVDSKLYQNDATSSTTAFNNNSDIINNNNNNINNNNNTTSNNNNNPQNKESLRNVMVYISGRKHTWDAINWCFKHYLKDGDNLIIVSRVPQEEPDFFTAGNGISTNSLSNSMGTNGVGIANGDTTGFGNITNGNNGNTTPPFHDFWSKKDEEEMFEIKRSVENLKNYIFKTIELLNLNDLKITISIELVKTHSVKDLLKQVVSLYEPHVFVLSSLLSNLNLTLARMNYRLPVYIMKNLNVPTIVIPDMLIDQNSVSLIQRTRKDCHLTTATTSQLPSITNPNSPKSATFSASPKSRASNISIVVEHADSALETRGRDPGSCSPKEICVNEEVKKSSGGGGGGGNILGVTAYSSDLDLTDGVDCYHVNFNDAVFLNKLNSITDTIEKNKDFQPLELPTNALRPYKNRQEPQVLSESCASSVTSIDFTLKSYTKQSLSGVGYVGNGGIVNGANSNSGYFSSSNANYKLGPSIKFSDNLKVPRSTTGSTSNSQQVSRRSSALSNSVYKVKSLLDDDYPSSSTSHNGIERTKSMSSALSQSLSLELGRRKSSSAQSQLQGNGNWNVSGPSALKKVMSVNISNGNKNKNKEKEKKNVKEKKSIFGFFKKKK